MVNNNMIPNTINQNQDFSMAMNIGILLNRNLSDNEQKDNYEDFIKSNKIDTVIKHFNEKDSKIIMYRAKSKQSLIGDQNNIEIKENLNSHQKQLTLTRNKNNI